MGRLPETSEMPAGLEYSLHEAPGNRTTNVLILLHGLGDSHISFSKLGANFKLPETCCISIRAPHRLPFDFSEEQGSEGGNWMWYKDISFDQASGQLSDCDGDFSEALDMIKRLVDVLLSRCEFNPQNLFFFGFGQGAIVSLEAARQFASEHEKPHVNEPDGHDDYANQSFGGVVSIGGVLPTTKALGTSGKIATDVLVCSASPECSKVSQYEIDRLSNVFHKVQQVVWTEKEHDSMPRGRKEWHPIMEWWSKKLEFVSNLPSDAIRIA